MSSIYNLKHLKENEPLARHAHFRIGGPARYFFDAETSVELEDALRAAHESKIPFFVLGGGSNVLISDDGFHGLVIKASNREYKIDGEIVEVGAGTISSLLARKTAEAGLSGFEWAITLPGTIGGAVRGNSGCFGGETKDAVSIVKFLQIENGEVLAKEFGVEDCKYNYRDSIFKHMEPAPVILSARFRFSKDDPQKCLERLEEKLRARKEKQPIEASSAGCVFKNFEFVDRSEIARLESRANVPQEFIAAKRIPAGWIVEELGLKGKQIGDAKVSEKHGNFILNTGNAKASDVVQLISLINVRSRDELGVHLHEEVQFVGF